MGIFYFWPKIVNLDCFCHVVSSCTEMKRIDLGRAKFERKVLYSPPLFLTNNKLSILCLIIKWPIFLFFNFCFFFIVEWNNFTLLYFMLYGRKKEAIYNFVLGDDTILHYVFSASCDLVLLSVKQILFVFPLSHHALSCPILASHLVASRLAASGFVASRLVTSRLVTSRLVTSRLVTSRLVTSRPVASRLVASHLVASHLVASSLFTPWLVLS